ncbi:MAG TPA: maleylpyruvate isomerase family mycothiol-dependent enzyme [Dehalococcoidia bacterium]|nr:maleylpyruvate isomerase family mycothiol-dependent enzyme [Dehalococcoidia bacterium]
MDCFLACLRVTHRELFAEWSAFGPGDFDWPSACPGWTVRDVVAHLRTLVSRYPLAVVRGLNGEVTPFWLYPLPGEDYAAADRREVTELRARPGWALVTEFAAGAAILVELFARLSPEDAEAPAGTPRGTFKARHVPFFYIYELGLHDWDIRAAFDPAAGIRPSLAPAFARILRSRLPSLVRRPDDPAGMPDRVRLSLSAPIDQVWQVVRGDRGYQVTEAPAATGDETEIRTDLTTLALVTSGRLSAAGALDRGAWRAADRDLALRFGALFAGPV